MASGDESLLTNLKRSNQVSPLPSERSCAEGVIEEDLSRPAVHTEPTASSWAAADITEEGPDAAVNDSTGVKDDNTDAAAPSPRSPEQLSMGPPAEAANEDDLYDMYEPRVSSPAARAASEQSSMDPPAKAADEDDLYDMYEPRVSPPTARAASEQSNTDSPAEAADKDDLYDMHAPRVSPPAVRAAVDQVHGSSAGPEAAYIEGASFSNQSVYRRAAQGADTTAMGAEATNDESAEVAATSPAMSVTGARSDNNARSCGGARASKPLAFSGEEDCMLLPPATSGDGALPPLSGGLPPPTASGGSGLAPLPPLSFGMGGGKALPQIFGGPLRPISSSGGVLPPVFGTRRSPPTSDGGADKASTRPAAGQDMDAGAAPFHGDSATEKSFSMGGARGGMIVGCDNTQADDDVMEDGDTVASESGEMRSMGGAPPDGSRPSVGGAGGGVHDSASEVGEGGASRSMGVVPPDGSKPSIGGGGGGHDSASEVGEGSMNSMGDERSISGAPTMGSGTHNSTSQMGAFERAKTEGGAAGSKVVMEKGASTTGGEDVDADKAASAEEATVNPESNAATVKADASGGGLFAMVCGCFAPKVSEPSLEVSPRVVVGKAEEELADGVVSEADSGDTEEVAAELAAMQAEVVMAVDKAEAMAADEAAAAESEVEKAESEVVEPEPEADAGASNAEPEVVEPEPEPELVHEPEVVEPDLDVVQPASEVVEPEPEAVEEAPNEVSTPEPEVEVEAVDDCEVVKEVAVVEEVEARELEPYISSATTALSHLPTTHDFDHPAREGSSSGDSVVAGAVALCVGNEVSPEVLQAAEQSVPGCGISLSALLRFIEDLPSENKDADANVIVEDVIKPATVDRQCRYVDTLDEGMSGLPQIFVAAPWGRPLSKVVEAVQMYANLQSPVSDPATTFVWLAPFSANQHTPLAPEQRMANTCAAITSCSSSLLCLDQAANALSRAWILYEAWCVFHLLGPQGLTIAGRNMKGSQVIRNLEDMSIDTAMARDPRDAAAICKAVSAAPSSFKPMAMAMALVESAKLEAERLGKMEPVPAEAYATALQRCAAFAQATGMQADSEALFKAAVDVSAAQAPPEELLLAELQLAEAMLVAGKYDEAAETFKKAITSSSDGGILPATHPAVLRATKQLAVALKKSDQHEEAEVYYRKVVEGYEAAFGPVHENVAIGLLQLATCSLHMGKLEEAEQLAKRALEIYEKLVGDSAPDTLRVLGFLKSLAKKRGNAEETASYAALIAQRK